MRYTLFDTPLGDLLLASDNNALVGVWFADTERPETGEWQRDNGAFGEVTAQLRAYFAGELTEFSLELAPRGTPFQHRVWDALQRIPYGTTTTYGKLAEGLGDPRHARRWPGEWTQSDPDRDSVPPRDRRGRQPDRLRRRHAA